MNNIEQIEITHQSNGKKKKVQVSWLLSNNANWYMDAQPFLITDAKIGDKLHGEFSGKPVKVRMLSKYPYLKSRLEDYEEEGQENQAAPVGNDEPTETEEAEATDKGTIGVVEDISKSAQKVLLDQMDIAGLKNILKSNSIEYNTRKKSKDYFLELALNTIK